MMIAAGSEAVLVAFLSWYTVSLFTVNGTSGDGPITLVRGGILALLGVAGHP